MSTIRPIRQPFFSTGRARFFALIIIFIGIFVFAVQIKRTQLTNTKAQLTNCTVTDTTQDAEEQKLLQLINAHRQQQNLSELTLSQNLTRAATWMSNDMASKNYLNHTDSFGRTPDLRLTQCGYSTFNVANGENIAGEATDAQATFDQWKNSTVHNTNMLTPTFHFVGISRTYNPNSSLKWYWVANFGGQEDQTTTPTLSISPSDITPTATPITTPSTYCLGPCLTPTIAQDTPTPTTPLQTPTPTEGTPTLSENETPTPTPSTVTQPNTTKSKSILSLLLGIIALILEFLRNLF
jgi:uncharacterized protein YkwD